MNSEIFVNEAYDEQVCLGNVFSENRWRGPLTECPF